MLHRAVPIALALLLVIAGTIGGTPRAGAASTTASGSKTTCCGGDCQCGEACRCTAEDTPAGPDDDSPALPERSRGERAPLVAVPLATIAPVTRSEPIALDAQIPVPSDLPAPPSCRLRLAIVSRWTT